MKIGILAYHAAINFGANLQVLSTYGYLKSIGCEPVVINWLSEDLERFYAERSPEAQVKVCHQFREKNWHETKRCYTSDDINKVIVEEGIDAVIIGSDAVLQNHPIIERLQFPTRRIFNVIHYTSDRLFPNPFWGDFIGDNVNFPLAMISGSSQDSRYSCFSFDTRRKMYKALSKFRYISVRDIWTQKMLQSVSHNRINPEVTPDPVFAFNYNVISSIPSRQNILNKFGINDNYLLLSFRNNHTVSQKWLDEFFAIAKEGGYTCVGLPFSDRQGFGQFPQMIELPLSPLDWYALIKYSGGYVGHNMHPIVVSIHNGVPFYSFDNYGIVKLNGRRVNDDSSKIKHILEQAGLEGNRISCIRKDFMPPSPNEVFRSISSFDTNKEKIFASAYYHKYLEMMDNVINSFTK